jgi:hypothetical protein
MTASKRNIETMTKSHKTVIMVAAVSTALALAMMIPTMPHTKAQNCVTSPGGTMACSGHNGSLSTYTNPTNGISVISTASNAGSGACSLGSSSYQCGISISGGSCALTSGPSICAGHPRITP